ncbi:flagellar filament capping protein FliD [Paenibacillus sp. PR3]|uniref:Flagellar filament capping protein FliD n=1 Tax=Paenibacillus terricola TaxID=2763503 RepID=A0ABR8N0Q1_9BACL|nr:flagellar filament capping protein FliD [Paenibacillus terricola]MBD3920826.1 flagellar filament capping protein FliD [Paenibacillus terricola]
MPIRLTGMSSGLDVESMVKELMKAERIPVNKLQQKKQTIQWKVDAYTGFNLKFSAMRESISTLRFSSGWKKTDSNGNTVRLSTDEMVTKIKDFVSKYNEMVTSVNGDLTEKVDNNYRPLTSDEKAAMNETDITNWENKAKEGLLRNDSILRTVLSDMRGIPSAVLTGTGVNTNYDTLSEIGIKTNMFVIGSSENGKLQIDETKLRAAIEADPDAVVSLLTKQGTGSDRGLLQRVYETMNTAMTQVSRKINGGIGTAASLVKQMSDIDKNIISKNTMLDKREEFYYKMFSNMEAAVNKGNAQMAWLSQQFG